MVHTVKMTRALIDHWLEGGKCPAWPTGWRPAREVPLQREGAIMDIKRAARVLGVVIEEHDGDPAELIDLEPVGGDESGPGFASA